MSYSGKKVASAFLTVGLIAFLSTSFASVMKGPINQCYEVNDSISSAGGQSAQPAPQEEQPTSDTPKEEKKSISTLSGNVLHYLIYKLKLSDILSDENNEGGSRDKIISMA